MKNHHRLALTPPMGWNSWDCFGAAVNEEQLKQNAGFMAANLKKYGWQYIVCDIQWYEPNAKDNNYNNFTPLSMDEYGRLIPAENRFPSSAGGKGFKPIADFVHSLGLKFGIHIMRGIPRQAVHADVQIKNSRYTARQVASGFSVCSWNTDMYGTKDCEGAQDYYNSIFELYASWGVDFVKCDDIAVTEFRKWDNPYSAKHEIEKIRHAIDNCGREMVLSLSPGPADVKNAEHLAANANMWRMTGDFWDIWDNVREMFDRCKAWQDYVRPGAYPDCDMLPFGVISKNGPYHGPQNRHSQLTNNEQTTVMTLWGIFGSPLMFGGNLPETDDKTLSLLTNEEYLKMHRERKNGREFSRNLNEKGQGSIIWTAVGKKCKYAALFNTKDTQAKITLSLSDILMPDSRYEIYNIWDKRTEGTFKNAFTAVVPPHGAVLVKINEG